MSKIKHLERMQLVSSDPGIHSVQRARRGPFTILYNQECTQAYLLTSFIKSVLKLQRSKLPWDVFVPDHGNLVQCIGVQRVIEEVYQRPGL